MPPQKYRVDTDQGSYEVEVDQPEESLGQKAVDFAGGAAKGLVFAPVNMVRGIAQPIATTFRKGPAAAGKEFLDTLSENGKVLASGNPNAIGQMVGNAAAGVLLPAGANKLGNVLATSERAQQAANVIAGSATGALAAKQIGISPFIGGIAGRNLLKGSTLPQRVGEFIEKATGGRAPGGPAAPANLSPVEIEGLQKAGYDPAMIQRIDAHAANAQPRVASFPPRGTPPPTPPQVQGNLALAPQPSQPQAAPALSPVEQQVLQTAASKLRQPTPANPSEMDFPGGPLTETPKTTGGEPFKPYMQQAAKPKLSSQEVLSKMRDEYGAEEAARKMGYKGTVSDFRKAAGNAPSKLPASASRELDARMSGMSAADLENYLASAPNALARNYILEELRRRSQ